jgi:hypothetical protein
MGNEYLHGRSTDCHPGLHESCSLSSDPARKISAARILITSSAITTMKSLFQAARSARL